MPTGLYHRIKKEQRANSGELAALLKNADAVVVGAGSGLRSAAAAGLMYSGERLRQISVNL